MKNLFKYVKTDKIIKWSFQLSTVSLLSQLVYTGFSYLSLPPLVPLFNQLPWGEDRLGQKYEIFIPCILTLLFLIGNLFLINALYEKLPLLSRILSITALLISILSLIFIFQTLSIIL
jgi:hypothetical protein